jgi:hypothetical protein
MSISNICFTSCIVCAIFITRQFQLIDILIPWKKALLTQFMLKALKVDLFQDTYDKLYEWVNLVEIRWYESAIC